MSQEPFGALSRVAALALIAVSARAFAEERPLSLAEALALAESGNPDVRAVAERASAQAERAEAARRLTWPRVTLTSGFTRTDNPAYVFADKLNGGGVHRAGLRHRRS